MMNRSRGLILIGVLLGFATTSFAQEPSPLQGVRRAIFLGDSITYSGGYIEFVEAALRIKNPKLQCEFLNLGLPSETVSGLSEPGHAGGQFARPELRERLDRVLSKLKPDLIVACYGMNDGIYYPYSETRFMKFQEGMTQLRSKASAAGAKVIHITPPVFDPVPIKSKTLPAGLAEYARPYEGYDDVLDRYSAWLLSRRAERWVVVDVHGPMQEFLEKRRVVEPSFRLAADGVHIDSTGHAIIARQLLLSWGLTATELPEATSIMKFLRSSPQGLKILELVRKKQTSLRDAWLTETGHKRPGLNSGMPIEQAKERATELEGEIAKLLEINR